MKVLKNIGIIFIFSFCCLSCQKDKNCCENSDLVNFYMFYNVTDWRPFLDKRLPKDSILQEKILKVSILIGEFARDAIDASGGLNSDGSLTNPCSHIRINESEVNEFYQNIDALLGEIHNMNKNSDVYKDLNTILQYNFYREKGSLSRNVLLSSSVEKVAAKLLVFENYCYFLIVKYA